MLDDPKIRDTKAESVRRLNDLAKIFRTRRMDAGALTLASPEVRYSWSSCVSWIASTVGTSKYLCTRAARWSSSRHTNHVDNRFLQVRFVLDSESQNPTDVQMYALKETNALVEEFMLLANITVGKKILR